MTTPTTTPSPGYELLYDAQGAFIGLREYATTHSPAGLASLAGRLRRAEAEADELRAIVREQTEQRAGLLVLLERADAERTTTATEAALTREVAALRAALTAVSDERDAAQAARRAGLLREAGLAALAYELHTAAQAEHDARHAYGAACERGHGVGEANAAWCEAQAALDVALAQVGRVADMEPLGAALWRVARAAQGVEDGCGALAGGCPWCAELRAALEALTTTTTTAAGGPAAGPEIH